MKQYACDVLIIGGGPAGLAAAYQARETGAEKVVVLERNSELGGILTQCIHNGFGVSVFGDDLTGPEYAGRWVEQALATDIETFVKTMVLDIQPGPRVIASNEEQGLIEFEAKALVLAMGCRERPRGALAIPGTRPAGVYTAGMAQRMVNMEGYMPGENFVILGSGDIGMIMARRLTLEGAHVSAMLEVLPYVSGLKRNLVQCIKDFDIPLYLSTTVTRVNGRDRVESVTVSQVDERWRPVAGTERDIPCDTLLLSVGLIPENELSMLAGVEIDPIAGGPFVDECMATSVKGVFAAGNVVHVYDLVDEVTRSALRAGQHAAEFALGTTCPFETSIPIQAGDNVHHVVPQHIHPQALAIQDRKIEFRVRTPIEAAARAEILADDEVIVSKRLRYVRPSEMIILSLGSDEAAVVEKASKLTVRIR